MNDSDAVEPSAEQAMGNLINSLDPGSFVTKWLVVAEVIDTDGDRAVIAVGDEDLTRWDTYGLLTEAMMQEKTYHIASRLDEE